MGTIAEKLTYLNTTKIKLRDSLNKFGSSILSTDTFRSYDTKLNEIYDKLPKITQSGAGFTLENVQNGQVDDFKMIGTDLEQNTTTGKNLFQSLITPSEFYKATYTKINDNSFSLNYTQSSTSNFSAFARIDLDISKLKPDTEYTISATNAVDGVTFSNIGALRTRINGVNGNVINSNILTFTTPNTIENVGIYFYIAYMNATTGTATITFNNIQVEEGSTATDYEPYTNGASPNPDYPQEIKVVEGRQVITDKGKNLFDKDNANIIVASFSQDYKTISQLSNNAKILYISCKENTTYTVSKISSARFRILTTDIVPALEVTGIDFIQNETSTSLTITTSSNVNYLCVYYFINGTDTLSEQEILNSIQIEEGPTATDYEPYYEPVSYNIDLTNDLLKYSKCDLTSTTKAWYFLDGGTHAYGSDLGTRTNIKFPVEVNKTYTFRYNISIVPITIQLCYENETMIGNLSKAQGNNTFTFTSDRNGYVIPRVQVQANTQVKITDISAVEGEEDYYDYKLAKMPNTTYKNRIYKNNGNWYFEENVKKIVLDGSEVITIQNIGTDNWYYQLSVNCYKTDQLKQICSHYNNSGIYNSNTYQGIMMLTEGHFVRIRYGEEDTVANFKAWLSNNNVTLWYPLVNPVTTQITNTTLINQLEALYLHTGTNIITISNDNNIIPEIEITRLKELEKLS